MTYEFRITEEAVGCGVAAVDMCAYQALSEAFLCLKQC
jgi:hypothetical protein